MQDRQFVPAAQLEAAGNEIVIHGYFHERPRRARGKLCRKIRDANLYPRAKANFMISDTTSFSANQSGGRISQRRVKTTRFCRAGVGC